MQKVSVAIVEILCVNAASSNATDNKIRLSFDYKICI